MHKLAEFYLALVLCERDAAMSNDGFLSIAKRPSGNKGATGRGDYELTGESNGCKAADLTGRRLYLCLNGHEFRTHVTLGRLNGKLRLRLDDRNDKQRQTHIAGFVAALLLLPEPCRSEKKAMHLPPIVQNKKYLLDVSCTLKNKTNKRVVLEPVRLTARTGALGDEAHSFAIDVKDRVKNIQSILERAETEQVTNEITRDLARFGKVFNGPKTNAYVVCREARDSIMKFLNEHDSDYLSGTDPLPLLRASFGLGDLKDEEILNPETLLPANGADDSKITLQHRTRGYYTCRRKEGRGANASKFRNNVMEAYNRRCVVCGLELPKVSGGQSGIEAAHILPWRDFDLDVIENGIALCRNHHWAFDNGVIAFKCTDVEKGSYSLIKGCNYDEFVSSVELPNEISKEFETHDDRPIDDALLPIEKSKRPSPDYLKRLNAFMPSIMSKTVED